jgi:hypothetical protein
MADRGTERDLDWISQGLIRSPLRAAGLKNIPLSRRGDIAALAAAPSCQTPKTPTCVRRKAGSLPLQTPALKNSAHCAPERLLCQICAAWSKVACLADQCFSNAAPPEPEALRLLAPQRGLFSTV